MSLSGNLRYFFYMVGEREGKQIAPPPTSPANRWTKILGGDVYIYTQYTFYLQGGVLLFWQYVCKTLPKNVWSKVIVAAYLESVMIRQGQAMICSSAPHYNHLYLYILLLFFLP